MPPPRRRRPVQPATRVRIPRTARSRSTPADESAGGSLPVAEAPGNGLAHEDLAHEDLAHEDVARPESTANALTQDEAAGNDLVEEEQAWYEAPADTAATDEAPTDTAATDEAPADDQAPADEAATDQAPADDETPPDTSATDEAPADEESPAAEPKAARGAARHPLLLPTALGALAVILGGLAVWFGLEASSATSGVDASNTALTDPAATRQVTQQVTSAVNKIFSYNYADTAKTSQAAAALLTGQARQQYDTLFKLVRQDAPKEKLILTTTVTNSGVEFLNGSQARLLIFADQHDTSGTTHNTTDAGAMFAVNAVNQGGRWKISGIDTFHAGG